MVLFAFLVSVISIASVVSNHLVFFEGFKNEELNSGDFSTNGRACTTMFGIGTLFNFIFFFFSFFFKSSSTSSFLFLFSVFLLLYSILLRRGSREASEEVRRLFRSGSVVSSFLSIVTSNKFWVEVGASE